MLEKSIYKAKLHQRGVYDKPFHVMNSKILLHLRRVHCTTDMSIRHTTLLKSSRALLPDKH